MIESNSAKLRVVGNRDNEGLLPTGGNGFVIGYLDDVNGTEAAEVPGFVVTRAELAILAQHYAETAVDLDVFMYVHEQTGSDWLRQMDYSDRRLNRIDEALGEGIVDTLLEMEHAKHPDVEGERAESREWMKKEAAKNRAEFYKELMQFVRGEDHTISPGTVGAGWAEAAKSLIAVNGDLALPENMDRLLEAIGC